jgi:hypothetical protein
MRAEATKILEQLTQLSRHRYVSPYDMALVHVGLGETDMAFDWLQKALAARSSELVFLNWDDKMDAVRSDQRYGELVRRVGLPQ